MTNEIKTWQERVTANTPLTDYPDLMKEEIAELRVALAAADHRVWCAEVNDDGAREHLAELRAKVESLAADAERLDKLEEIMGRTDSGAHIFSRGREYSGETMREVLDLVIAKEKA